ncbi:MAG: Uma2 family endonuclease [Myxacorys chilensis ATA2-1-KO14]|jgi:Uma2 family endonuclease|nr:Uma2 family endonuclease [Myxacorys chilensis ATA2-1-KO14]
MSSSTLLHISQIQLAPGSSISLSDVSWTQYQAWLIELGDHRAVRFAYNQGTLTLTMPSQLHEIINRLLAKIIVAIAEELNLRLRELGSTRFEREDLDRGIEPDSCFYIQNADRIVGLNPIIPDDLPPDLAIEVDITSSSSNKLKIYQAFGFPELWTFQSGTVTIRVLDDSQYVNVSTSKAFPIVTTDQLNEWVKLLETTDDLTVVRAVRQFVTVARVGHEPKDEK